MMSTLMRRSQDPTVQKQILTVASVMAGGSFLLARPSFAFRAADIGSQLLASHIAVEAAYPAIYPSRKLGIQYGGTGEVTTLAKAIPQTGFYGYAPRYIPMLDFGFQITNVPVGSSRVVYEQNKSRGAKDSPSMRTGIAGLRGNGRKTPRKTMRGPSAQKKKMDL